MTEGVHQVDLSTNVRRIEYDFEMRAGFLHMSLGCCTDMSGCIRLFQRIDPNIRVIYTLSGSVEDVAYYREQGTDRWRAIHGRFNMHAQDDIDDELKLGRPRVGDWCEFPRGHVLRG
jgi:hypothetical protein